MNSVYQILLNMPELTLYFLSKQYNKDKKVSGGVADAFRDLLLNINNANTRNEKLKNLKEAMADIYSQYKNYNQNDASEFFSNLFSQISIELNNFLVDGDEYKMLPNDLQQEQDVIDKFKKLNKRLQNKRNLFLSRLFYFYKTCFYHCTVCNTLLKSGFSNDNIFETCDDISKNFKTLYDIVKLATYITCDEKIFCKKCDKEVQVYQKNLIVNAPNYLFVVKNKCDGEISKEHSLEFQVNDFSLGALVLQKQDTKYDLVSVICRTGNEKSGHFFTYSKKSDGWYYFSDSCVKKMPDDFKINEDKSIKNDFYYIVYKKKDMLDKDLFDGYDINDFVHDKEDLKIIAEQNEIKISDELDTQKGNSETEQEKSETKENGDNSFKKPAGEKNINDKINEIEKPLINVKPENPKIKRKKEEKPKNETGNQINIPENKSLGKEIFKSFGVWSFSLVMFAGIPIGITTNFVFGLVISGAGGAMSFMFVIIKIILLKKQMKKINASNKKENKDKLVYASNLFDK